MQIGGIGGGGYLAYQRGAQQVKNAASEIAAGSAKPSGADASQALVELKSGQNQAQAGVKAIEAEQRSVGSLLDVTA